MRLRGIGGVCVVAVVMGTFGAEPAGAATTIGQLDPGPPTSNCSGGVVFIQAATGPAPTYVVPAGGGVVTSWATLAGPGDGQVATLKMLARIDATHFQVVGTSGSEPLAASVLNTFPVRIPVTGFETPGYYFPTGVNENCNYDTADANDKEAYDASAVDTEPAVGTTLNASNQFAQIRINIQVTIEADVDHDGFGDESQDGCKATAGPVNGCPVPPSSGTVDKTKPVLGGLSLSSSVFKAATSGGSTSAQKKKSSAPTGTRVAFSLSEPSSVKFTVERKTKGRRVSGKCKARTKTNAKKPKCTRYVRMRGSFTVAGKAGKNTFKFRGRVGGKSLKPGSYRLNGRASDKAKNTSVLKRKGFRIVK
jgi:hypothetical protein